MKNKNDLESSSVKEYTDLPEEFSIPDELNTSSMQNEFCRSSLTKTAKDKGTSNTKRILKALLYYTVGSAITLSIMIPSFGAFFFGSNSGSSSIATATGAASSSTVSTTPGSAFSTSVTGPLYTSSTSSNSMMPSAYTTSSSVTSSTSGVNSGDEHADSAFPLLGNLDPNGYINDDYGVLDEEYICIENNGQYDYLVFHDKPGQSIYGADGRPVTVATVDGLRYDSGTNTLYISDYHGGNLFVNLMGNGFKINVIGDSSLDLLVVYGFYYGGSVTITGSGRLVINENLYGECGLILEAEQSVSCLMIDKDVTLEVYGTETALIVRDSVAEKGIYYLSPQILTGGKRIEGLKSDFGDNTYNYVVSDPLTGEYAKYVKFSK